jgi:hypothetical protein
MDKYTEKMIRLIQDDVLDLVLMSFEENSDEKAKEIKRVYGDYDNLISLAQRPILLNTVEFIDFIDGLYSKEDNAVKAILSVLRDEAQKELAFKPEFEAQALGF